MRTSTDAAREAGASRAARGAGPGEGRVPLTRERILQGAVRIMDAEGLEAVTMRRLGRELGVEAMSLYNHVPGGKEAVRAGILDTVLGEFDLPDAVGDWLDRLRHLAQAFRRLLLAHPNALPLFAENQDPSPGALPPVEMTLEALRGAGLSVDAATDAYCTLVGFVMGSAMLEIAGLTMSHADPERAAGKEAALRQLPLDRFPRIAEMVANRLGCAEGTEFDFGLEILLAGFQARLQPRGASPPAPGGDPAA